MDLFRPFTTGRYRPRLCENALRRVWQSESQRKTRPYANFRAADQPRAGRFYVATQTSKRSQRFYTAWAIRGHSSSLC